MKFLKPGDRVVLLCPPGYRLGEPGLPGDTGFVLGKLLHPINLKLGYLVKLDTDGIKVWVDTACVQSEPQPLGSWYSLKHIWQPDISRPNKPRDYSSDKRR